MTAYLHFLLNEWTIRIPVGISGNHQWSSTPCSLYTLQDVVYNNNNCTVDTFGNVVNDEIMLCIY